MAGGMKARITTGETYTDPSSGITLTHNDSATGREFFRLFTDIARRQRADERAWVARLRAADVKAAHPDDGWVDRDRSTLHFAYATFNDGANVGDVVALGSPERFRLVRLTGFRKWIVGTAPSDGDWSFEPLEVTNVPV